MSSKVARLVPVLGLMVVVAACGGPGASVAEGPASAAPSVSAAPVEPVYSMTPEIAKPDFESLRGVSRASAEAAFKALVGYVREDSFAPRRMQPKSDYPAADFAGPLKHMTPQLAKFWRQQVAVKFEGEATGRVKVIALFNVQGPNSNAFADRGPLVVNERISRPTVEGAGGGALEIELTYDADLRMKDTVEVGKPILVPVTKTVTYALVRSQGKWLINNYEGSVDVKGLSR